MALSLPLPSLMEVLWAPLVSLVIRKQSCRRILNLRYLLLRRDYSASCIMRYVSFISNPPPPLLRKSNEFKLNNFKLKDLPGSCVGLFSFLHFSKTKAFFENVQVRAMVTWILFALLLPCPLFSETMSPLADCLELWFFLPQNSLDLHVFFSCMPYLQNSLGEPSVLVNLLIGWRLWCQPSSSVDPPISAPGRMPWGSVFRRKAIARDVGFLGNCSATRRHPKKVPVGPASSLAFVATEVQSDRHMQSVSLFQRPAGIAVYSFVLRTTTVRQARQRSAGRAFPVSTGARVWSLQGRKMVSGPDS